MKYVAFDIETTGFLMYEGDTIFAYVFTYEDGTSDVRRLDGTKKEAEKNKIFLQRMLDDLNIGFVCHNAKFEIGFLLASGYTIPEKKVFHCTMILTQFVNNLLPRYSLDFLAKTILGYDASKIDKEIDLEAKKNRRLANINNPDEKINKSGFKEIDKEKMALYQIADGERTMLLFKVVHKKVYADEPMYKDYLVEIRLLLTTVRMEKFGIRVDFKAAKRIIDDLHTEKNKAAEEIRALGYHGNPVSNKQLGKYLFDVLKVPVSKYTPKGDPAMHKLFMLGLREMNKWPIIDPLIRYKTYGSGITTIQSYMDLSDKNHRLHPTINTNKAKTGRQSCENPNLQNVSTEVAARSIYGIPARSVFIPDPDHILFLIDYSGIEFRLICNQCGEEEFIKLINENGNVHDVVSDVLYGEKWHEVCALADNPKAIKIPKWVNFLDEGRLRRFKQLKRKMRQGTKNYDFGIAYGGSFNALTSALIGLTPKEKRQADKNFRKRWPSISEFPNVKAGEVRKQGYITTAFGRKLKVPRELAYRGANYDIQGTAAGMLKRAENRLDDYFKNELDDKLNLILPVHDELVMSYPRNLLHRQAEILWTISDKMTKFEEIRVRMDVEAKVTCWGWSAAKPYKFPERQN